MLDLWQNCDSFVNWKNCHFSVIEEGRFLSSTNRNFYKNWATDLGHNLKWSKWKCLLNADTFLKIQIQETAKDVSTRCDIFFYPMLSHHCSVCSLLWVLRLFTFVSLTPLWIYGISRGVDFASVLSTLELSSRASRASPTFPTVSHKISVSKFVFFRKGRKSLSWPSLPFPYLLPLLLGRVLVNEAGFWAAA